jgi:hypothetical protein
MSVNTSKDCVSLSKKKKPLLERVQLVHCPRNGTVYSTLFSMGKILSVILLTLYVA